MYITDLNRAGGIGANSLFVEIGPFRVLVDAGMHPKAVGREAMPRFELLDDVALDLIILTHCHLDHLGSLPVVAREHPGAEIWMSRESAVLAPRMMRNSVRVMSRQREEADIPEYPLFTDGEVKALEERFTPIPIGHTSQLHVNGQVLEVEFYHAGHVPGAVSVLLRHGKESIMLSGDVLFTDQHILPGASRDIPKNVNALVLETTRGGTSREPGQSRDEEIERLVDTIADTISQGGSVLLPVFALGRMQEILSILHEGFQEKLIPECPVYTSGLGMDLANYFDYLSKKNSPLRFRKRILKDLNVRRMPRDIFPGKNPPGPAIYVASSGMMVANTPSYRLAAAMIGEPSNAICFVGYCDPDAHGYKVLSSKPGDSILFETLDYRATSRANIERFDLSSHADREELLDYAIAMNPGTVILSHGDPDARGWFEEELYASVLDSRIIDPEPLKRVHC
ncbi:MBL fold metallo-hydrolase [Puniceicoccus vermicola]|uniref:MBL fold metallo-hydrolase n=1 Tax=Puniceicoccus vermicola TaxID=388746 RepID=A0A7X1B0Q1_9BACT|nr:MBL fold metallo-hydrolase [Puniceicoccus vermicola]MBC2603488.1 MBL fold metallo-hydrolase [Puniceicoccus vermicola]